MLLVGDTVMLRKYLADEVWDIRFTFGTTKSLMEQVALLEQSPYKGERDKG